MTSTPAPDTEQRRWQRVVEIVDEALKRPEASERERFLKRECAGDDGLRREVEELLRYEDVGGGARPNDHPGINPRATLKRRPAGLGAEAPGIPAALAAKPVGRPSNVARGFIPGRTPDAVGPGRTKDAIGPGERFGPFVLGEVLGQGGMGTVYRTTDPELGRTVALKVLRREFSSDDFLQRFDAERRLLARLDHPAIASIYGGGDVEGVLYFTMEAVDGEPIDAFCDHLRLGVDERLRLVLQVCGALEHAHRNLVVHRDVKPANVLVNADGEVKLVDFGIAKDVTRDATQTADGRSLMTLAWASPEQVRQKTLTTSTDVYSLGVLLYTLLCGHPPYVLDGDFLENQRRVCEDEPAPPSDRVRVAREDWADGEAFLVAPGEIAAQRGTTPRRLQKRLRGDLDAVVLKALRKDPDERYLSIAELARDLRRFLDGLPVTARRASLFFRVQRSIWRQRRRWAAALVLLVVLTLIGVVRWRERREMSRLEQARREAVDQADVMRRVVRNLLRAADPDQAGAAGQRLGAVQILANAEAQMRVDVEPSVLLAHGLEAIGRSFEEHDRLDDARRLLNEARELYQEGYGAHPLTARALNNLGALEHRDGNLEEALRLYRGALAMKEEIDVDETDVLKTRSNVASVLLELGAFDEAETLYRAVLDARRRLYEPRHPDVATSLRSLGVLYTVQGRYDEAEPLLREAYEARRAVHGERHTRTAAALSSLGKVFLGQERFDEAEAALSEALAIREEKYGDGHRLVASSRRDLALLYDAIGETATAGVLWSRALAVLRRKDAPRVGWEVADAESRLGEKLLGLGRKDEAAVCLRESWEALRRLRGDGAAVTRRAEQRLALLQ